MESIIKKLKLKNIFDNIQEKECENLKKILPMKITGNKENPIDFIICSCGVIRENHNSHCLICKKYNKDFIINGTYKKLKNLEKDIFFYSEPLVYKRKETKQSFLFLNGNINLDINDLNKTSLKNLIIDKVDVFIVNKNLIFYLNDKETSFLNIIYSIKNIEKTDFIKTLIKQTENINKTVQKNEQIDWFINSNNSIDIKDRIKFIQSFFDNILFINKELSIIKKKFYDSIENVYNYDYNKLISLLKEFSFENEKVDLLYSDTFYHKYFYQNKSIDFVKIIKKLKNKKYEEDVLDNYLSYFKEENSESYNDLLKIFLYNKDVDKVKLNEYLQHVQENEAKDSYLTIYTYACYLQKKKKDDELYPVDLFLTERTMKKGVK